MTGPESLQPFETNFLGYEPETESRPAKKYDLSGYKTMVFDFDGVILDSEEVRTKNVWTLFPEYPHLAEAIEQEYTRRRSENRLSFFRGVRQNILHLPFTQEDEQEFSQSYNDKIVPLVEANIRLIPGINEFLEKQEVPFYIATSGPADSFNRLFNATGIDRNRFVAVSTYPVTKSDALIAVYSSLGFSPLEVVMFGDAPADFMAATSAGVDFIAVTKDPSSFPTGIKSIRDFTELI